MTSLKVLIGFSWIIQPKIRLFVYIPLAINIVLFALTIGLLATYAEKWVGSWSRWKLELIPQCPIMDIFMWRNVNCWQSIKCSI
ncbi:MAG: hypothetical protein ACWIPH_06830 [Ostreibacterium sp.]